MAKTIKKHKNSKPQHDVGIIITTPSHFGSHASMVVDHKALGIDVSEDCVLCEDDTHVYITYKNRLDTGLADPKRYS